MGSNYDWIYNVLSLGIASMLFTSIFLWVARDRVLPKFRMAVMVSATVTSIAAYHYFRMFDSFVEAYGPGKVEGATYNVGYRYVDWLLTVPLLLVELVAVMGLASAIQSSLLKRLVPAAAAMIILGYPGDTHSQLFGLSDGIWGALSTIPFLYILYVLFVEIGKSLSNQSAKVQGLLKSARMLLLATWGVYPITFILGMDGGPFASGGGTSLTEAIVAREIGYSIADILAKCVFGLLIFTIARVKSAEENKEFAAAEFKS